MSEDVQFLLGKILTNQDNFMKKLEDHILEDRKLMDKVLGLETKITYFTGIVTSIAIVWGIFSHYVLKKLGLVT
jgi:hypothetical protein